MLDCPIADLSQTVYMGFRQLTFQSITAVMVTTITVAALVACGDPKGQSPPITLTFSTTYPIPASLNTGSTTGIEVIVANDNQDAGVTFTCTPNTPTGECGSFTPPSAGSNVPSCFQAPAMLPGGDGTVVLTATSLTDPTKSISSAQSLLSLEPP
jgi:hypothetical protein